MKHSGFAGLRDGLLFIRQLLESYWDSLYPSIEEDGNVSYRAEALEWLNRLDRSIKEIPLLPLQNEVKDGPICNGRAP